MIAGAKAARRLRLVLQAAGIAGLTLALAAGGVVRSEGFTLTTLLFWVALIVGMILVSALISGAWEAADPWTSLERVYRLEDAPVKERAAP